jgi:hypothetical protein
MAPPNWQPSPALPGQPPMRFSERPQQPGSWPVPSGMNAAPHSVQCVRCSRSPEPSIRWSARAWRETNRHGRRHRMCPGSTARVMPPPYCGASASERGKGPRSGAFVHRAVGASGIGPAFDQSEPSYHGWGNGQGSSALLSPYSRLQGGASRRQRRADCKVAGKVSALGFHQGETTSRVAATGWRVAATRLVSVLRHFEDERGALTSLGWTPAHGTRCASGTDSCR